MSANLIGKKIVVLGGTSGIGLATAKAAASEGATVVVVSSNQKRVNKALAVLPGNSQGYAINLANETAVSDLFKQIGFFDHLIFTAGEKLLIGKLADLSSNDANEAFQLRFFGALNAVKYGSKNILPGGSVVLTTGIAGLRPQAGWAVGASICGAMESLTRALAVELAPIRVNAVSPGFVKTNLWSDMTARDRETMYQQVARSLPVQRVGEAEDIAKTYLYLMNEGFSTGQIIVVDGGAVLV
ncbi:SDR family oxidoreductase [Pedobacter nototheniae]|uniref:SDR family oxidoreductase n=1 Tax=Pedobacter nototheniae TaxID=2488994 RepID=UPI00103CB921|nr:SDR family oxidoreductase [Pedobacter nototheniae]